MYINPYGADPVTLAADLANRRPLTSRELVDRCREAGVTIDRSASDADLGNLLTTEVEIIQRRGRRCRNALTKCRPGLHGLRAKGRFLRNGYGRAPRQGCPHADEPEDDGPVHPLTGPHGGRRFP